MGLMTRLATLLKADAHGMVDALEDRALLLRQHVREAGAELARKKSRLEGFDIEEKDLRAEAGAIEKGRQRLEDDVALAMNDDHEDLARFAIKKLLPLRRRASSIERRLEALGRERAELAAEVARQEEELEELQRRVRAYLARRGRPEGPGDGDPSSCWWEPVANEEVELELLRRRREGAGKGGS